MAEQPAAAVPRGRLRVVGSRIEGERRDHRSVRYHPAGCERRMGSGSRIPVRTGILASGICHGSGDCLQRIRLQRFGTEYRLFDHPRQQHRLAKCCQTKRHDRMRKNCKTLLWHGHAALGISRGTRCKVNSFSQNVSQFLYRNRLFCLCFQYTGIEYIFACRCGETGRRKGLKIRRIPLFLFINNEN